MEALMGPEQVAKVLGVPVRSVHRLVRNGLLRARRVGRLMRFTESDVAAFIGTDTERKPGDRTSRPKKRKAAAS